MEDYVAFDLEVIALVAQDRFTCVKLLLQSQKFLFYFY